MAPNRALGHPRIRFLPLLFAFSRAFLPRATIDRTVVATLRGASKTVGKSRAVGGWRFGVAAVCERKKREKQGYKTKTNKKQTKRD